MRAASCARRWLVRGDVQGVGFRFFVQRAARRIGRLSGYVRNLDDGSVEVYAAGETSCLSALAGFLHQGPPGASVRAVEQQNAPVQQYDSFEIQL